MGALLWGMQAAFLNPSLALILVNLFGASAAQVGLVLAIYNTGGFAASLIIPGYADRQRNYLGPLVMCGVLTLSLAVALGWATSLPWATVALVALGGPASVGNSLLFAHLMHSGASTSVVVNTRAFFSFAWVAGPPLATALIGWFGIPSVLVAFALVAMLNILTSAVMLLQRRKNPPPPRNQGDREPATRAAGYLTTRTWLLIVGFALGQATNAAAIAVVTLFVTLHLGLPVFWAGLAAGLAAALEIPALIVQGRLSARYSDATLLLTGCASGIAYYLGMVFVSEPVALLALQALNAWFYATIAGIGLTMFAKLIPKPGLANGIYSNTLRVGYILAGPVIAIASGPWGYPGLYAACAGITVLAAAAIALASRSGAGWAGPVLHE